MWKEHLDFQLKENPKATFINLENKDITDLDQTIPYLAKFPCLKQLSMKRNKMKNIPAGITLLTKIESLDLRDNDFDNIEVVANNLMNMASLKHLMINIFNNSTMKIITKALPNLITINSESMLAIKKRNLASSQSASQATLSSNNDPAQGQMNIPMRQEDLEAVAMLFDCLRELYRENSPEKDSQLAEEFDEHVKMTIQNLADNIQGRNGENRDVNTHVLWAKFDLYQICVNKLVEYVDQADTRIGSILEGIQSAHESIVVGLMNGSAGNGKRGSLGGKENSGSQASQLLEAAERLEEENKKLRNQNEGMLQRFAEEKEELDEALKSAQEENSRLLEFILKRSKSLDVGGENDSKAANSLNESKVGEFERRFSVKKSNHGHNGSMFSTKQSINNSKLNSSLVTNPNLLPFKINNSSVLPSSNVGTIQLRVLTLKQLKDAIEEIYESKLKFDQRCIQTRLPIETLEQYMYTFLNHKYGLKVLIIEWAMALLNGIKKYAKEDNDVAVFGKILKNEFNEDFHIVQNHVKATIKELLKVYWRNLYPLKHNKDIKNMLEEKTSSSISAQEAYEVIKYMFEGEDGEVLVVRMKRLLYRPPLKLPERKLSRVEMAKFQMEYEEQEELVEFSALQQLILNLQLKNHEKFLTNFLRIFKDLDKDNNGIINEEEFMNLKTYFESFGINLEPAMYLHIIDPYQHEQITFSQCVSLLSSETVEEDGGRISLLQKLAMSKKLDTEND